MYVVEKRNVESLETQTVDFAEMDMQKIDDLIFKKYGFSPIECSQNTYRLDAILRKVFGPSHLLLERTILENVLDLAVSTQMDKEWVLIQGKSIIYTVLNSYADKDKDRILAIASEKPHIIAKIIDLSGVQESTAYKKINELIRDGLLIECGAVFTSDARQIKKYVGVFKNMKSGILNNKIAIKTKLTIEALDSSQVILLLQNLKNKIVDERQQIKFKQQIQLGTQTYSTSDDDGPIFQKMNSMR